MEFALIETSFFNTSFIVGIIFLFTAIAKVIEPWKFVEHIFELKLLPLHLILSTSLAFIALESALGIALILGLFPSLFIPVSILLLIALTIVAYWSTSTGRTEDCGCYNGWVDITPAQSLILNGIYIFFLISNIFFNKEQTTALWQWIVLVIIPVLSCAAAYASLLFFKRTGHPFIDLTPLKENRPWKQKWLKENSNSEILSGSKLIVFLSSQCPVCKKWLNVLKVVHYRDDLPEVIGVIDLTSIEEAQEFISSFGLNYPVTMLNHKEYNKLGIVQLPTAILLEDGIIQQKWQGGIPEYFIERIQQGEMSYPTLKT